MTSSCLLPSSDSRAALLLLLLVLELEWRRTICPMLPPCSVWLWLLELMVLGGSIIGPLRLVLWLADCCWRTEPVPLVDRNEPDIVPPYARLPYAGLATLLPALEAKDPSCCCRSV